MQRFHFERLIRQYSTEFYVKIPVKGGYDESGDYVEETTKKRLLRGAIISHRENKVFKSGGTLTEQDKALFMLKPLEKDLQGAEVIHRGKVYNIGNELENAEFTGVYAYTLKFVSVFNGDD